MKVKLLLTLFIFPLFLFGNMANYYVDGSKSSTLYGSRNCKVLKENLTVTFNNNYAKYKVTYKIQSKTYQKLNLLFIGLGLTKPVIVLVNNEKTSISYFDTENPSNIAYSQNDSFNINQDDLMYFDPKQEIRLWIKTSIIENNGGLNQAKERVEKYLEKESLNKNQNNKNL
jgi:hypothetical protein